MYFLIAGYKHHAERRTGKNIILKAIASVFRNAMFGMALLIILDFAAKWFEDPKIEQYTFEFNAYWSSLLVD
jgi:hypothetical protein